MKKKSKFSRWRHIPSESTTARWVMHNKMHNLQQAKINNITGQFLQGAQIRFLGAHNGDGNRHCAEYTTNCCQRWIRSEWFEHNFASSASSTKISSLSSSGMAVLEGCKVINSRLEKFKVTNPLGTWKDKYYNNYVNIYFLSYDYIQDGQPWGNLGGLGHCCLLCQVTFDMVEDGIGIDKGDIWLGNT